MCIDIMLACYMYQVYEINDDYNPHDHLIVCTPEDLIIAIKSMVQITTMVQQLLYFLAAILFSVKMSYLSPLLVTSSTSLSSVIEIAHTV